MKNTRRQAVPILSTLHAINGKYGKLYCFPAQLKIMELLGMFHGVNIAIATLNRWLRDLEDKGYIIRKRRHRTDKKLGMVFQSTLYTITILGYHTLKMTGVSVWREINLTIAGGIKGAGRYLSKFRGPVSIKTVLAATGIFGSKKNKFVGDK